MEYTKPADDELFGCPDMSEIKLLAMEFPHAFGRVKDYLIYECHKGNFSGKTYGDVRFFIRSKFGDPESNK